MPGERKKTDCLTDQKRAKVIILNPIISFLINQLLVGINLICMYLLVIHLFGLGILKQKQTSDGFSFEKSLSVQFWFTNVGAGFSSDIAHLFRFSFG